MVVTLLRSVVKLHAAVLGGSVKLEKFRDQRDTGGYRYGSTPLGRRKEVSAFELDLWIPAASVEQLEKGCLHSAVKVRIDRRERESEVPWLVPVARLVDEC